ncbi:hypothetical protein DPMN_191543 [Dreissena polymorpha]|uniref:Uncharacterized protein n=1 Tax=Dreissena polymorpha TaxID=45954 RepID=A0A9D3Y1G5_DREPO|nr:hypothetical protein DPMN_191543 [Dreissena polymorpha]
MLVDIRLTRAIIVAVIEDDALLGIDILQKDKGGPADPLLSRGVILFKGLTYHVFKWAGKKKSEKFERQIIIPYQDRARQK